jgi:hypothetical protein
MAQRVAPCTEAQCPLVRLGITVVYLKRVHMLSMMYFFQYCRALLHRRHRPWALLIIGAYGSAGFGPFFLFKYPIPRQCLAAVWEAARRELRHVHLPDSCSLPQQRLYSGSGSGILQYNRLPDSRVLTPSATT